MIESVVGPRLIVIILILLTKFINLNNTAQNDVKRCLFLKFCSNEFIPEMTWGFK